MILSARLPLFSFGTTFTDLWVFFALRSSITSQRYRTTVRIPFTLRRSVISAPCSFRSANQAPLSSSRTPLLKRALESRFFFRATGHGPGCHSYAGESPGWFDIVEGIIYTTPLGLPKAWWCLVFRPVAFGGIFSSVRTMICSLFLIANTTFQKNKQRTARAQNKKCLYRRNRLHPTISRVVAPFSLHPLGV